MEDKLYYIWTKREKLQLTQNFNTSELECKCSYPECQEQKISKVHIEKLQKLRDKLGPLKITSGYRCKKHNDAVGGSPSSRHVKGDATDIQASNYLPIEVADQAESFDGLGRYKTFTHVDSRGVKTRWGSN